MKLFALFLFTMLSTSLITAHAQEELPRLHVDTSKPRQTLYMKRSSMALLSFSTAFGKPSKKITDKANVIFIKAAAYPMPDPQDLKVGDNLLTSCFAAGNSRANDPSDPTPVPYFGSLSQEDDGTFTFAFLGAYNDKEIDLSAVMASGQKEFYLAISSFLADDLLVLNPHENSRYQSLALPKGEDTKIVRLNRQGEFPDSQRGTCRAAQFLVKVVIL